MSSMWGDRVMTAQPVEVTQAGGHTRSSGQTVCCCTVQKRADSAPFGLWVQTPQPVHEVTGVRDWPVTRDQHETVVTTQWKAFNLDTCFIGFESYQFGKR